MANCGIATGFLFWKKACGAEAMGVCRSCGCAVCQRHGASFGDGTLLCTRCGAEADVSTGTVFGTAAGLGAAGAVLGAPEQPDSGAWHGEEGNPGGFESGGSDAGDSGGGDSGGSSSD